MLAVSSYRMKMLDAVTASVIVLVVIYSGFATIREDQARKDYASRYIFTGFEIVEVKLEQRPLYYRDGNVSFPIYFRDVDEFIKVARNQNVHILYRIVVPGDWVYYYFESPIYDENYMAYEREITPPIRYTHP